MCGRIEDPRQYELDLESVRPPRPLPSKPPKRLEIFNV